MRTENLTVEQAIRVSQMQDRIVRLDGIEANEIELLSECEGSSESNDEYEFWGADWRIHIPKN